MANVKSTLAAIASHPFALGATVGAINGVLAGRRGQAIETDTALAILIPTIIAEAYLAYKNPADRTVGDIAASTAAGIFVGLAPFTRWDPSKRAWLEPAAVGAPATLSDLRAIGWR